MESPAEAVYREHPPPAELAPWIDCFWLQTRPMASAPFVPHRVLPDGSANLLIDLSRAVAPRASVVGPRSTALVVSCRTWSRVLGVRFRPGAARAFLGVPLWSLADQQVELSDLRHDSSQMRERLGEADRAGKVFVALEQELRAMLAGAGPPEPRVRAAIQRLARAPESLSIEVLAAETGLTRQRLSRLFRDDVGYGPKRLARILRLQRAIRLLRARTGSALAEVALDAGYCDQPHMNGEFRALAGVAPLELAG